MKQRRNLFVIYFPQSVTILPSPTEQEVNNALMEATKEKMPSSFCSCKTCSTEIHPATYCRICSAD